MSPSELHQYDHCLCAYAVGTVAGQFLGACPVTPVPECAPPAPPPTATTPVGSPCAAAAPRPRAAVPDPLRQYRAMAPAAALALWLQRQLPSELWRHLSATRPVSPRPIDGDSPGREPPLPPNPDVPERAPVLLTDGDFEDLASAVEEAPVHGVVLRWTAWPALHRDYVQCLREIRALAPAAAEEFAARSREFARLLESPGLTLWKGVGVVQDWVREVRRMLRATGRADLLPTPDGTSPTLLFPPAADPLSPGVKRDVDRIARRIRQDPTLAWRSKAAVRRAVSGKAANVNKALDHLRSHGVYHGPSRVRPSRRGADVGGDARSASSP